MDSLLNNNTRMEATLFKSANATSNNTAVIAEAPEIVTTIENNGQSEANNFSPDQKKLFLEEPSSLKLKRCRHGRIIIKDLSKRKIVQQDDRETNQLQSKSTTETKDEVITSDVAPNFVDTSAAGQKCEAITVPINSDASVTLTPNEISNQSIRFVELEKDTATRVDKVLECEEKSPNEVVSLKRIRSKSPDCQTSKSRPSSGKPISNRSPSHKKSPRRDRGKSPRRRDRSRSPRSARSSRKLSSSRRHRSPRGDSRSPPARHRVGRRSQRSYRDRSPRRRRSHSRSSIRFRETSRSPRRENDRRVRDSDYERRYSRRDVSDIDSTDPKNQLITEVSKAVNSDKFNLGQMLNSETLLPKQSIKPQECIDNKSSQDHNHNNSQPNQPTELNKTQESSKQEDNLGETSLVHPSLSPSTNDSASMSSDIYDPEGPIIPISPGDSPPSLSSMNKAANNKLAYRIGNERNDDDVPSSAVQLNHQEKYLQKLNRQERVIEEVKLALKPHYQRRAVSKEQYKDVLRRAVPKICHSKNGEINPVKIRALIDAYVKKMKRHSL